MTERKTERRVPTFQYALLSLLIVFAVLVVGITVIGASLQVMMFLTLMMMIPIAMRIGFSYNEVETFAFDMVRSAFGVIMILMSVGALIGAWVASGTISTLTYAGLQIIAPQFFLVTALILCSIVSVATGTSWGTLGSVGVALIGVANAFDINLALAAGAIVCGSVFGDKLSPFSDTTNLAAAVSDVDLMAHVKHMLWTTTPAYLITAIIFTVIGFNLGAHESAAATTEMATIMKGISTEFQIGWVPLLPLLVVLVLLLLKKPAFPSIFIGALAGLLVAVFYQGFSIKEVLGFMTNGYVSNTGIEVVDALLSDGGITSVLGTVSLFIFTLGLGGILSGSGILQTALNPLFTKLNSVKRLIPATLAVTYANCVIGASSNFSYSVVGPAMRPLYDNLKLDRVNLSRSLEDAGAVASVTIPWNVTAVFAAGVLGVSQFDFIPFLFLSFLSPLVAFVYALIGFSIKKAEPKDDQDGIDNTKAAMD